MAAWATCPTAPPVARRAASRYAAGRARDAVSLVVDEHRQYLDDRVRLAAFEAAIAEAVRPGDVVVDLACGTGILGMLACRAGAGRVYAIEDQGTIELARALYRANG